MPLYAYACPECDARADAFAHAPADRGTRTILCPCGSSMGPVLSMGAGATYFGEGAAGRWIHNLGDQPVFITSPRQHAAAMKAAGVTWATERKVKGTGGWV